MIGGMTLEFYGGPEDGRQIYVPVEVIRCGVIRHSIPMLTCQTLFGGFDDLATDAVFELQIGRRRSDGMFVAVFPKAGQSL